MSVAGDPGTLVILEAPHCLQATLRDLLGILGDRRLTICRELTKIHEEIFHGSISQAASRVPSPLVVKLPWLSKVPEVPPAPPSESDVVQQLRRLRGEGMAARQAIAVVSKKTGLPRRELYQLWLKLPELV